MESVFILFLAPLQFPLTVAQVELITLRACVFLKNSAAFGFSFTLPLCRCLPKKFSSGSWQIRLLRNAVTPSIVKRYSTNSTKASTVNNDCNQKVYCKVMFHIPVKRRPRRVGALRSILFCSFLLNPALPLTLFSHLSRYPKNSSCNH